MEISKKGSVLIFHRIYLLIFFICIFFTAACGTKKGNSEMSTVRVRYMVNDLNPAVEFYTKNLGFNIKQENRPYFALLSRGNLELVLSTPFGPGGAAQPMKDGSKAQPGGWNRIIINVTDIKSEVEKLKKENVHFRNDISTGPGGSEILMDDPSGNPIELFQPAG